MRRLAAQPLTRESFAPFGEDIGLDLQNGSAANQGTAERFDYVAKLEQDRADKARANLSVFRAAPQAMPFSVRLLERHPHSTQMFVPLRAERFLIIVAPSGSDGPALDGLKAFVCTQGQGINYKRGTWHHPVVALDAPAELIMLAWEDGTSGDCEERSLPEPIWISD